MDGLGIVPDAFEKACRERQPKALYVIPTIDNPTTAPCPRIAGARSPPSREKYDVTIVEDDPYAPLRPTQTAAFAELARHHLAHRHLVEMRDAGATASPISSPRPRRRRCGSPGSCGPPCDGPPPLMSALASRWIADGSLEEVTKIDRRRERRAPDARRHPARRPDLRSRFRSGIISGCRSPITGAPPTSRTCRSRGRLDRPERRLRHGTHRSRRCGSPSASPRPWRPRRRMTLLASLIAQALAPAKAVV